MLKIENQLWLRLRGKKDFITRLLWVYDIALLYDIISYRYWYVLVHIYSRMYAHMHTFVFLVNHVRINLSRKCNICHDKRINKLFVSHSYYESV